MSRQTLTRIINLRVEIEELEKLYQLNLAAGKEPETLRSARIKIAFLKLELISIERLFHSLHTSDMKYTFSLN